MTVCGGLGWQLWTRLMRVLGTAAAVLSFEHLADDALAHSPHITQARAGGSTVCFHIIGNLETMHD